jgi:hypothetical protein
MTTISEMKETIEDLHKIWINHITELTELEFVESLVKKKMMELRELQKMSSRKFAEVPGSSTTSRKFTEVRG